MKHWKVLTGFSLTQDEPKKKIAVFRTKSHMLCREKWHTIGRGRSTLILDNNKHPWHFGAEMDYNETSGLFTITVILQY